MAQRKFTNRGVEIKCHGRTYTVAVCALCGLKQYPAEALRNHICFSMVVKYCPMCHQDRPVWMFNGRTRVCSTCYGKRGGKISGRRRSK